MFKIEKDLNKLSFETKRQYSLYGSCGFEANHKLLGFFRISFMDIKRDGNYTYFVTHDKSGKRCGETNIKIDKLAKRIVEVVSFMALDYGIKFLG